MPEPKTKSKNTFSLKKRLQSFRYAFCGIQEFAKSQHNAWIHLTIASLVIIAGFSFSLSTIEWAVITIVIALVLMAEAFNTAIETLVDFISPEYDKKAGKIKDIAAGAVLIAAIASAIVGFLVFVPKLLHR